MSPDHSRLVRISKKIISVVGSAHLSHFSLTGPPFVLYYFITGNCREFTKVVY